MMKHNKRNLSSALATFAIVFSAAVTLSSSAVASGGGGGGGGFGGGGGGSYGGGSSQQRVVDQNYEVGKAIYRGRLEGAPKLSYCVKSDGEEAILPLKNKSLKPFKRATYNDFANALYNCESPDSPIASELKRDDFLYVIYYLNKRHKLNLVGS